MGHALNFPSLAAPPALVAHHSQVVSSPEHSEDHSPVGSRARSSQVEWCTLKMGAQTWIAAPGPTAHVRSPRIRLAPSPTAPRAWERFLLVWLSAAASTSRTCNKECRRPFKAAISARRCSLNAFGGKEHRNPRTHSGSAQQGTRRVWGRRCKREGGRVTGSGRKGTETCVGHSTFNFEPPKKQ